METTSHLNSFTRRLKRLGVKLLIAMAIVIPVRACVLTPYHISGDSVAPELRDGSWAVVYRLSLNFQPGDIVAYRNGENVFVGRVESVAEGSMKLSRRTENVEISRDRIVGKVVVATR